MNTIFSSSSEVFTDAPFFFPPIEGAKSITEEKDQVRAVFSNTSPEEIASCFFHSSHQRFQSHVYAEFTPSSHESLFLRIEDFIVADITFECLLQEHARGHIIIFAQGKESSHLRFSLKNTLKKNAHLTVTFVHLNESMAEITAVSDIMGEQSTSQMSFLEIGKAGKTHLSAKNSCQSPYSHGEIHQRTMLFGDAFAQITGEPVVQKNAHDCTNLLDQSTLLLSPESHIDCRPLLDIQNNIVSARHTSSFMKLLPEDIFFLQSRGISEKNAEQLILDGLLAHTFSEIPHPPLISCISESSHHFLGR